jgi:hypothetical protein
MNNLKTFEEFELNMDELMKNAMSSAKIKTGDKVRLKRVLLEELLKII